MLRDLIVERIRARGPITVAEYMELALYHPEHGYYARASRRSGRAGDFFTSVDVGPLFGELLARQFAEMWKIVCAPRLPPSHKASAAGPGPAARLRQGSGVASPKRAQNLSARRREAGQHKYFDVVEAGAGDGRLARDVLDAVAQHHPDFYPAIRLHLVERSPAARERHRDVLGVHAARLATSAATLPEGVTGVIYANELLDALPVHVVTMSADGLREICVEVKNDRLLAVERPPSTPELATYLARAGVTLPPGARVEIGLAAISWVEAAARALDRGFLLFIDYGHEANELYSASHASGTLMGFRAHQATGEMAAWLEAPGEHDLTAHVDLTSVGRAAEDAGLDTLGVLDQTYFLLGLGIVDVLGDTTGERGFQGPPRAQVSGVQGAPRVNKAALKRRLAAKTLLLPGGLGSTHKVMIFSRGVGRPELRGCSYRIRLT